MKTFVYSRGGQWGFYKAVVLAKDKDTAIEILEKNGQEVKAIREKMNWIANLTEITGEFTEIIDYDDPNYEG